MSTMEVEMVVVAALSMREKRIVKVAETGG